MFCIRLFDGHGRDITVMAGQCAITPPGSVLSGRFRMPKLGRVISRTRNQREVRLHETGRFEHAQTAHIARMALQHGRKSVRGTRRDTHLEQHACFSQFQWWRSIGDEGVKKDRITRLSLALMMNKHRRRTMTFYIWARVTKLRTRKRSIPLCSSGV